MIKSKTFIATMIILIILILGGASAYVVLTIEGNTKRWILLGLFSFMALTSFVFILGFVSIFRKQGASIKKSFDYYTEELISETGAGLIIHSTSGTIVWTSKFIQERFKSNLIGKSLQDISVEFQEKYLSGEVNFNFSHNGLIYNTILSPHNKTIVIKDITNQELSVIEYYQNKTVVAELEVDNFQRFQSSLPEEEVFQLQSKIIKLLDNLVDKYNVIYRQYANGKFLLITNQKVLDRWINLNFKFLTKVNIQTSLPGIRLTVSIGIGTGSTVPSDLIKLAKNSLNQSQARGGDQVVISSLNEEPKYFGATTEALAIGSRVQIRQIANTLASVIQNPKTKKVIIYGHQQADLDALGASFGLYELVKNLGKEAYIQNQTFDNSTKKALKKYDSEIDSSIFIKPSKATKFTNKNTVIIITDTSDINRTENSQALVGALSENIFILDHHRASKINPKIKRSNIYIDTSSSSSSEIASEVIKFAAPNIKLSQIAAQYLLAGIYLDTKNFQRSTSSRTFLSAAWLESFGAKSAIASEFLKISEKNAKIISDILANVQEIKPGFFLAASENEINEDVVSAAADEMLRTEGRVAAFVMAKVPGKKLFKMSARSLGVNVQTIAEKVGGGGHFGVAAAKTEEPLEIFKDNLIQAIVSVKHENNNN